MLEFEKKHKRGKKTLFYLFITKGLWFNLIGVALIYLSWAMYYGPLRDSVVLFLAQHETWYISVGMLSEWIVLTGISWIFVGYLNASVHYRKYKFMLDEYAVHLHKGLFFIREVTIPYQQISNVHIERPTTFRMFGLAQLDIVTAADRTLEHHDRKSKTFLLPIVDIDIARKLSRQLLECAARSRKGKHVYGDSYDLEDDEDFEEEAEEFAYAQSYGETKEEIEAELEDTVEENDEDTEEIIEDDVMVTADLDTVEEDSEEFNDDAVAAFEEEIIRNNRRIR
jgi:membrane protein YdbS with pleckstrin-like domain